MRIIIKSEIEDACWYVQRVINNGCPAITIFKDNTHVSCDKTKKGFKFNVWRPS